MEVGKNYRSHYSTIARAAKVAAGGRPKCSPNQGRLFAPQKPAQRHWRLGIDVTSCLSWICNTCLLHYIRYLLRYQNAPLFV